MYDPLLLCSSYVRVISLWYISPACNASKIEAWLGFSLDSKCIALQLGIH